MRRALAVATAALMAGACAPVPSYDGAQLFQSNCAVCHGVYGEGDGPVAADVAVELQDLRHLADRAERGFPREIVTRIIDGRVTPRAHGTRDMPIWGEAFAALDGSPPSQRRVDAKIRALVDYLQSIQHAAP